MMPLRFLIAVLLMTSVFSASANEYMSNASILRIRIHEQYAHVGFDPAPAKTCSEWGEQMVFNYKTEEGKAFLSTLLAAKVAGKPVQAWYTASTAIGKDQFTGCHLGTLSVLKGVAIP